VKWALLLAFCVAVGATTWAGAQEEQSGLRVTIGYTLPESDSEDTENDLGNRYWSVTPQVTVESERRCEQAELTIAGESFFNGGRGFAAPEDELQFGDMAGDGYRFEDHAEGPTALAGETARIRATVRCISGDRISTATAQRDFELPTASCDQGPLRVGEVEGRVRAVDVWAHEEQGERVLRPGFLITPGSELSVAPAGRAEIGAPECNGLRVTLGQGDHVVGSYSHAGRGSSFSAENAVAEGDAHAGGVTVPDRATVWPIRPSSYEVRSTAKRVTVRVTRGAVLVGGPEDRPTLRVPAGHQASVLCSAGTCRAGHVRLFQAQEPWSTPPEGIVDRMPRRVTGESPPLSAFAPPFATIQAERLPAAGGEPDQVVIAWSREVRRADDSWLGFTDKTEQGFLGWKRVSSKRWELVYELPLECCPTMAIETGDVTGDGHLDALTRESQGSGGCGFSRVLISSNGRLGEEFAYDGCDYSMKIEKGAVVLQHGVGPCPSGDRAHCSGGTRVVVKRWNGSKLVTVADSVTCLDPGLDPARTCRPKTERD
jgi:hypothetical protein